MESPKETAFQCLDEEARDLQKNASIAANALEFIKTEIAFMWKDTEILPHSSASEVKSISSFLLNVSKQCDLLEECLKGNVKVYDSKTQKQHNYAGKEILSHQVEAIKGLEEKLDNMLCQSNFMQSSMYVLLEQLHISIPHFSFIDFKSSNFSTSNSDMNIYTDILNNKPNVTCPNFLLKLQELSLKMRALECNIINCQNLSLSLVAVLQQKEMINDEKDHYLENGSALRKSATNKRSMKTTKSDEHAHYLNCSFVKIPSEKTSSVSTLAINSTFFSSLKDVHFFEENSEKYLSAVKSTYPSIENFYSSPTSDILSFLMSCEGGCIENLRHSGIQTAHCNEHIVNLNKRICRDCLYSLSTRSTQNKGQSVICSSQCKQPSNFKFSISKHNFISLMKQIKDDYDSFQEKEASLVHLTQQLQKSKDELEGKLLLLQAQSQEALSKKDDFRKRADFIISKEREEFHQQINILRQERESLMNQATYLQKRNADLQAELDHVNHILLMNKVNQEQDVTALRLQLSTESLRYEKALKRHADQNNGLIEMKNQLSQQEQLITDLENAIDVLKCDLNLEKANQMQELEEIYLALSTRDEECFALNEDLKKCVAEKDRLIHKNNVLMSHLLEQKMLSDTIRSQLEAKMNLLQSDSNVMRKNLVRLIREKDMLWQRTDQLTHLQKVQLCGKWINDAEVTNCSECNNRFKFTLRKHHCRLCGKIFCHACTDNWLIIAASRCKTRVCNECYEQHEQLKKAVNDGSSVHIICKDSEEDDIIETSSYLSSKWESAVASSMNSTSSTDYDSTDNNLQDFGMRTQFANDEICTNDKNFHVITDEEIEMSLSSSSPYNALQGIHCNNSLATRHYFSLTRSVTEIESTGDEGVSGEIWILAGVCTGIPILCDTPPVELHWKFICDKKAISFTIFLKENDTSAEVMQCNKFPEREGSITFLQPGMYILQFDNSFSRFKARKVQYTLWIKPVSEVDSTA